MTNRPLRVGFDLDGVILYNPARIVRPLVVFIKERLFKITKTQFFVPTNPVDQWIWKFFHYSSLFTSGGLEEIKKLSREGKIEAYIITGRYGFLRDDFEKWLTKIDAKKYFKQTLLNERNEQPHLFKLKTIEKLRLDVFVEDNWDIVQKLNQNGKSKTKVLWIYNIFDRTIPYKYKFPTLRKTVQYIKENCI